MNKEHKIEFGVIIAAIVISLSASSFFGAVSQADATFNPCFIFKNHKCPKPTQTPTPTINPCISAAPNDLRIALDEEISQSPCVTPSVEPSAIPTDVPVTTVNNSSGTKENPTCTEKISTPLLQGVERLSPTSVKFSWWPVEAADKYAVTYGYDRDHMNYGQSSIDKSQNSIVLNDLQSNVNITAKVVAYRGICSSESNELSSIVVPKGAPATGRAE